MKWRALIIGFLGTLAVAGFWLLLIYTLTVGEGPSQ
jgi:hypothetical protein